MTGLIQARVGSSDIISHAEPSVSILFCDIMDFMELMTHMPPIELVSMLNLIYSAFDVCSERHDVQKMETVGKTYMVSIRNSCNLFISRLLFFVGTEF